LIFSLNEGLSLAKGKYIVREDADDYSEPERIDRQVSYMEKNLDIVVAGTQTRTFGAQNGVSSYPTSADDCKAILLLTPPVSHPSVVMRRKFLEDNDIGYSEAYKHCEDFGLWVEVAENGGKISNLDEVLHHYHVHSGQVSILNKNVTAENHFRLVRRQLESMGFTIEDDVLKYFVLADKSLLPNLDRALFRKLLKTYRDLMTLNATVKIYQPAALRRVIFSNIVAIIRDRLGLPGFSDVLFGPVNITPRESIRLGGLAILRTVKRLTKGVYASPKKF